MVQKPELETYVAIKTGSDAIIADAATPKAVVEQAEDQGYDRLDFSISFNLRESDHFIPL